MFFLGNYGVRDAPVSGGGQTHDEKDRSIEHQYNRHAASICCAVHLSCAGLHFYYESVHQFEHARLTSIFHADL